ncbi:hypothetical protein [Oscillibacter sp.]|uniref:hypothetical protein n=1 Tax=Oscillibacter sp. TaxID=1945593 RepID=UPI0026182E0D|nr:hypothetical protein [Oscillibacter sp.]
MPSGVDNLCRVFDFKCGHYFRRAIPLKKEEKRTAFREKAKEFGQKSGEFPQYFSLYRHNCNRKRNKMQIMFFDFHFNISYIHPACPPIKGICVKIKTKQRFGIFFGKKQPFFSNM